MPYHTDITGAYGTVILLLVTILGTSLSGIVSHLTLTILLTKCLLSLANGIPVPCEARKNEGGLAYMQGHAIT